MVITIASGKGGTGKTTVAINLALSLGTEKVMLLDCDVEEPNAHLFLSPKIEKKEKVYIPVPKVDDSKCDGCGECSRICQFKAIVVINKITLTFPELCHGCGGCIRICPNKAISESNKELGEIFFGKSKDLELIWGKLRIGEPMAPPIIKEIKKYKNKREITLIDAPPGTSCPVIASIKGADYTILVTEPTPFGFNDLKLTVDVVKTLKIPFGIVINRSDLGTEAVKEYAEKNNIPILLEIPFDEGIAKAYSKGIPFVEEMPEYKEKFVKLYTKIEQEVRGKNEGSSSNKR